MSTPIVTFTSDFGLADWFVGVVRGVIVTICPTARVVDLTHEVPPGHVERGAFVLEAAAPDFPPGTVHLAVVDPGVGTSRRALAVRAHGQYFVGPDNGLLEWALGSPEAEVHALTDTRYFRPSVSRTFHGRDVFAPVAAHLADGAKIEKLGARVTDPVRLELPMPALRNGELKGRIVFVDRFGNALTDLDAGLIEAAFRGSPNSAIEVIAGGKAVRGISGSYGDAPIGTLVAIIGSSGRLEIAEVGGHAASRWGLGVGDDVKVRAR